MPFKMCILCFETYNTMIGHNCGVKDIQGKHVDPNNYKIIPKTVVKRKNIIEFEDNPKNTMDSSDPISFRDWMQKHAPKVKVLKL